MGLRTIYQTTMYCAAHACAVAGGTLAFGSALWLYSLKQCNPGIASALPQVIESQIEVDTIRHDKMMIDIQGRKVSSLLKKNSQFIDVKLPFIELRQATNIPELRPLEKFDYFLIESKAQTDTEKVQVALLERLAMDSTSLGENYLRAVDTYNHNLQIYNGPGKEFERATKCGWFGVGIFSLAIALGYSIPRKSEEEILRERQLAALTAKKSE